MHLFTKNDENKHKIMKSVYNKIKAKKLVKICSDSSFVYNMNISEILVFMKIYMKNNAN
jgi:hypothetical protein